MWPMHDRWWIPTTAVLSLIVLGILTTALVIWLIGRSASHSEVTRPDAQRRKTEDRTKEDAHRLPG